MTTGQSSSAISHATRPARGRLAALLLASTILGCAVSLTSTAALAQARPAAGAAETVNFQIPAQPLSSAIDAFVRQSGWQISYSSALARGKTSTAVSGPITPSTALQRLVAGTGIKVRVGAPGSAALIDPSLASYNGGVAADGSIILDTITVQGESAWGPIDGIVATRSASGTKTDTPLLETPQSVSVISAQEVKQKGAQSLVEALQGTPGLVSAGSGGGYDVRYDNMSLRGFSVRTFLNGLSIPSGFTTNTHGMPQLEPYGLERIEVLRGPSSVLYGQSTPGGILSLVSKRPTEHAFGEVQLQTGSYGRAQTAFDIGGPLTSDGTLLYRLTGLGRLADTQVDFQDDKRLFIAPAFTWRPTNETTFTFLSSYMKNDSGMTAQWFPAVGTLLPNPNGRIPSSRFLGEKDYDKFERELATIGYMFEHRFSDQITFRQNLQYAVSNTDNYGISQTGYVAGSDRLLNRNASYIINDGRTFSVDNQIQITADTGPFAHKILLGADYQKFSNEFWYRVNRSVSPIDAYAPVYTGYTSTGSFLTTNHTSQDLTQVGFYAQDQIRFDKWLLTLSGRHDTVETDTYNHVSTATTNRTDSAFSGRVGLNYIFESGFSPYVSYSTSFQPVLGTSYSGGTFEPSTSEQFEFGIKYQSDTFPLSASAAYFDLTQSNITTADAFNSGFLVQQGEARNRGFEFEAKSTFLDSIDLIASYTYSESEITKSNDSTVVNGIRIFHEGNRIPFVPRHQASLWANYTFAGGSLEGLSLGAGVRWVSSLYGDSANAFKTPAATFVDLAANYDFGQLNSNFKNLNLQVNVKNLFDEEYITCNGATTCFFGAGRSALATLTYRW